MKNSSVAIKALVFALGFSFWSAQQAAHADSVADFYKDKLVSIISPYPTGSAYTAYALLVKRHLGKFLPGAPSFTLKIMPGAGGLVAANFLYQGAPKDGTVIAALARGAATEPLLTGKQTKAMFDGKKFNWLMSFNSEVSVALAWHTTGIKTIHDAQEKELLIATGGGSAGDSGIFLRASNALLGTKFKAICCYQGTNAQNLAMERGEVGGRMNFSWAYLNATKPEWLREKKVNILFQMAMAKHADLPDIPLVLDLAKNPSDRKVLELIFSRQAMGRPYAAPPDVPADRVAALRSAFDAMVKDTEFRADADRQGLELNDPLPGKKIDELLTSVYDAPDDIVDRARAIVRVKKKQ